MLLDVTKVVVFALGVGLVAETLFSAIRTFVLPRSVYDRIARAVFLAMRRVFDLLLVGRGDYRARDQVMALYAPVSLLALDATWLALVELGYVGMYWALGARSWSAAFTLSGSSLLTLGFATDPGVAGSLLVFSEAMIGLTLVALLIAYLPTIYTSFSRREAMVTLLEVRAGSPPSPIAMLERFHRIAGLEQLHQMWLAWETWFADVEETHTSLAVLTFFRSPRSDRSWITAAGTILDAAALAASTLDVPRDAQADLCIRAGFIALRHIADVYQFTYDLTPQPGDPISITRAEFDAAYEHMAQAGLPLKPDREQAWRAFAGWRVNYDRVLLALASLLMAPPGAMWSSDRMPARKLPPLLHVGAIVRGTRASRH
ncbi:MAG TPA: hypothetical protein VGN32_14270 [Ktedonobacterales bacterium]|jgi:hypothetical protein|nr:hypothetical protein [Ktedonobacterales bacterium]